MGTSFVDRRGWIYGYAEILTGGSYIGCRFEIYTPVYFWVKPNKTEYPYSRPGTSMSCSQLEASGNLQTTRQEPVIFVILL